MNQPKKFQELSRSCKLYIAITLVVGAALCVGQLPDLPPSQRWLLVLVGAVACLSQLVRITGRTPNSSYDWRLVVFGFALIALSRPAAVWLTVVAGLAAWIRHRDAWYIHTFNMGMNAISISAAGIVYEWVTGGQGPLDVIGMVGIVAAIFAYTLVNHLMLGTVILLAKGETFAESGTLDKLILALDFTLFAMGTATALIWRVNPYAVVLMVSPVYLIYLTLQMPALQRRAESDPKTGLFDARYFNQALNKELQRAERFERPLCVIMADLDYLRTINNTYGHLAGDAVLIGIAAQLRKAAREYDVVARFGGEEFAILAPEATPEEMLPRIEAIRAAIEATTFQVGNHSIKVTMSFGIAGRERPNQLAQEILQNADQALYQAKQRGRNQVCNHVETELGRAWTNTHLAQVEATK